MRVGYQIVDENNRVLMTLLAFNLEDALEEYDAIEFAASGVWYGTENLRAIRSEDDDD